jgi:hypothetical protein
MHRVRGSKAYEVVCAAYEKEEDEAITARVQTSHPIRYAAKQQRFDHSHGNLRTSKKG